MYSTVNSRLNLDTSRLLIIITGLQFTFYLHSPYEARTTPSVFTHGNFSFSCVGDRRDTLAPAYLKCEFNFSFLISQKLTNLATNM